VFKQGTKGRLKGLGLLLTRATEGGLRRRVEKNKMNEKLTSRGEGAGEGGGVKSRHQWEERRGRLRKEKIDRSLRKGGGGRVAFSKKLEKINMGTKNPNKNFGR